MMHRFIFVFAMFLAAGVFAQTQDSIPPVPKGYVCYRTNSSLIIDGVLNENDWLKAEWTSNFVDIEGSSKPTPRYRTRAKMLWDSSYLYIAAELKEPHIWATFTERESIIYYDNDFEVFIDPDGDNHLYYEFEINAFGTEWDLLLPKPYKDKGHPIFGWSMHGMKSGVKVYGTINNPSDIDSAWTIELALPFKVLKECNNRNKMPKPGDQWRINFSRVEWEVDIQDGKYVKKKCPKSNKTLAENNWVWSPQGVINMHNPETWGYLQFSSLKAGEGADKLKADEFWEKKMELIAVYKLQKKYKAQNGKFARTIEELAPNSNFKNEVDIEASAFQFVASISNEDGTKIFIDHERKIVHRKSYN